jgi:serine/threonine protein kinase
VHLLAEKHTGVPYAIKAIELKQESKLSKMIERECSILQMVQHPNVVNLKYSFRNHNRLYLVMSYIRGGNLKQVVERDKLGLAHMLMWFAELVLAIEYLHSLGIIHRDVKPVNCMIGEFQACFFCLFSLHGNPHLSLITVFVGTDGHLKLGDFGLSKVVDSPLMERRDVKATDRYVDSLGLQSESMQKVRKFLPLKLDAAQREEQQAEITAHRTVKVLLITMDDSKADSTLLFINTTVEVSIADYDIDSDTIKLNQFEAIFIDGDYYEEDSPELVAHFCSHIFNCLPVLLCAKSEDLRKRGLASGARACSRLPLEALTEDTFDSIFTSTAIGADPVHKYREDLIRLQEEKIAKLLAREAALVSQYEKGLTRNADATRSARGGTLEGGGDTLLTVSNSQRDSVRVESKSHSIVGTLYFIAPEVIRLRRYGKAVDWWACGITIYQCLVRNHLFEGRDKKETMENIMNAPIVLDELAPYGDAATSLIRGLLNRDNKRRLGSGSQGAQSIKSHKLFEKIDWATVSTSNPVHKPAQFVNKKFRADDRSLFYGPRRDNDVMPWSDQSTDLGSASMRKYISNKKRARQSGGGGSNSSWSGRVNRTLLSVLIANSGSIGKNT